MAHVFYPVAILVAMATLGTAILDRERSLAAIARPSRPAPTRCRRPSAWMGLASSVRQGRRSIRREDTPPGSRAPRSTTAGHTSSTRADGRRLFHTPRRRVLAEPSSRLSTSEIAAPAITFEESMAYENPDRWGPHGVP